MILQVLLLFFPLSFQPLLASRFFVDLFSELGQQKLNVKIHLFSSPHPAHHNAYTVQNIFQPNFSMGEQTTLTKYETSNYTCYLKKSHLIFTLDVASAPKQSGVFVNFMSNSFVKRTRISQKITAQDFRGKEASNPTAYRPWKQPRVGPMCHSYVLTARCDPISITSHGRS